VLVNSLFKEFSMLHDIIQLRDETAGVYWVKSALAPRSDNACGRRITSQLDTITQRVRPTGDNATDRTSAKEPTNGD